MTRELWTVILAAGAGRRLAPVTGATPKQFWKRGLAPSLLEDTVARMAPLAPPDRTLIVVDRNHVDHLHTHHRLEDEARILFQPCDRGTAAGVRFVIEPVLHQDPTAVVVLTPSDHGVADEARFRRGILETARFVRRHGGIVLFGVTPDSGDDDYGWVIKDGQVPGAPHLSRVVHFVEKPPRRQAEALMASGAIWNTMVLVARARDLEHLFLTTTPELATRFADGRHLRSEEQHAFFDAAYGRMPVRDFSHHVLTPAPDLLVYQWPASIGWSDLGTPERLARWHTHHSPTLRAGAA